MELIEPEAIFDPHDAWGDMLRNLAWLRGHPFTDVALVVQQHQEHIHAGLREAHEPFPRLLGTERQWREAGWRVLDGVIGYERLASADGRRQPHLYSLGEVVPVDLADDDMFRPIEPAELLGRPELHRRVCHDLTVQLHRSGYDVATTPGSGMPFTFIDDHDKTIRIPSNLPPAEQAGDLAHAATHAALSTVFERADGSKRAALRAIAESAAHVVMNAAGLDPSNATFGPVRVPVEPNEATQASLVLMVGDSARLVANRVLANLTTPVRHDGTTTISASRQPLGQPPRPDLGPPGPSTRPRPTAGPGL